MAIPEVNYETLAKAYSLQQQQANRRWAISAFVALFALNLDPTKESQTLLGTQLRGENLIPFVLVILAVTNLVYVVAHIVSMKAAVMVQEICNEQDWKGKTISKRFTFADYFYSQVESNYNRIWPIFERAPNATLRKILFKPFKLLEDTAQVSFAPAAMAVTFANVDFSKPLHLISFALCIMSISASIYFWMILIGYVRAVRA